MSRRLPHADRLLCRWAGTLVGQALAWGTTDCHALARQALAIQFGHDLVPALPMWHSKREALRLARRWDIIEVCQAAGAIVLPPESAITGDLVVEPRGPRWRASWVALALHLLGTDLGGGRVVLCRRPAVWLPGTVTLRFGHG